ncbi:MAG: hypothetical protein WC291_11080 [Thermodesulfovibrionales bacterium]|jgi:heme/copper-type cytochrome/quinol oxidase subunit 2
MVTRLLSVLSFGLVMSPSVSRAADAAGASSWSWDPYLILTAVVWVAVTIPIISFGAQHRKKGQNGDGNAETAEGSTFVEIAWTAAPLLIILLFSVR